MEALALIAVAAAFGYFATLVVRRYEVLRSIALDIDGELRDALKLTIIDSRETATTPTPVFYATMLDAVHERLIRAELQASSLPRRQRELVVGQIGVADGVAIDMSMYVEDRDALVQGCAQSAIVAAREVLAPLLLPPPLLGYRRAGKPRSYPSPARFREILNTGQGSLLDRYELTLQEGRPLDLSDSRLPEGW